jgi:ABC-type antimicrobial peptide transport system permease subunit
VKHWLPDAIYFLLEDMRHDWARTSLTVFGMAVVIFSFFILSSFSQSLNAFNQTTATSKNLVIIQADLIDPGDAVVDESAMKAAEALPGDLVNRVSPVIFRHLRINDHVIQLRAARVNDWPSVFHMELLEGQWPKGLGEVAAGEGAAEANGWKIGTILDIFGSEFRVSAIVRLPGSVFASVWMPLEQAQALFGMRQGYQMLFVQAAQGADAEKVRSILQNDPYLASRYSVFFEDTYSRRNNQLFKDISSLMYICSSLALLAVTFGTYTSTNLSLAERGREIGILRAVGFSNNNLGMMLSIRAMLQSIIAFSAGLLTALVYIAYQRTFAQLFVLGLHISFEINWQLIMTGFLLTSLLALFGAWLSSRRMLLLDVNHMLKD